MEEIDEKFFTIYGFEFRSIIAKGGYGMVYLVYSQQYKQEFAMKRILISNFKPTEIKCMMAMESPHICSLYQFYYYDKYVYMLLEYCPMSLYQVIMQNQRIPHNYLPRYIYGILLGIKECHNHNIAHSDIKPGNFLIDKYGRIKVCDFGLSKEVNPHGSASKCGSLVFMAPEIFRKEPYDPIKADIWSLGVTFYNMATGMYPFFTRKGVEELKYMITTGVYDSSVIEDEELRRLIASCLNVDPEMRPTVDELLKSPYLRETLPTIHFSSDKRGSCNLFKGRSSNIKLVAVRRNKISTSSTSCPKYTILPKLKRESI